MCKRETVRLVERSGFELGCPQLFLLFRSLDVVVLNLPCMLTVVKTPGRNQYGSLCLNSQQTDPDPKNVHTSVMLQFCVVGEGLSLEILRGTNSQNPK